MFFSNCPQSIYVRMYASTLLQVQSESLPGISGIKHTLRLVAQRLLTEHVPSPPCSHNPTPCKTQRRRHGFSPWCVAGSTLVSGRLRGRDRDMRALVCNYAGSFWRMYTHGCVWVCMFVPLFGSLLACPIQVHSADASTTFQNTGCRRRPNGAAG